MTSLDKMSKLVSVMTPEKLKKLRELIGYSKPMLAKDLEIAVRTVTRWENGQVPIPKMAEMALELIVLKAKRKRNR